MYLIFIGLYLTLALATVPGSVTTHQREKNAAFCAVGLFDIRVQRIYVKKKNELMVMKKRDTLYKGN